METPLGSGEVRPILTIDIVSYSTRSLKEQIDLYKALIEIVRKALPEQARHASNRIWSPSGDGGSLTFFNTDFFAALMTAINILHFIKEYNTGTFYNDTTNTFLSKPMEPLQIRTGIHSGPVIKDVDFDGRENIWGDGINISARVMGMGKPDQIVISDDYYKDAGLSKDKEHPEIEITYIGKWWAKHNLPILLYNVYASTNRAGIPATEVDEWFGPLHYPLENTIRVYEGMLAGEIETAEYPFRVAVLAKRILDLEPQNLNAKSILESLSERRFSTSGKPLYHKLFSSFSPATINYFFEKSNFKVYETGETIMTEGEIAGSMMMIVSGHIKLYKDDQPIRKYNKETKRDEEFIFPEGSLIGEMGIFEVSGKRNATLKASKPSMVLDIDYDSIRPLSGSLNSGENSIRLEIQRGIWQFYTDRSVENKIVSHRLFDGLDKEARYTLMDNARFVPKDYQTPPELTAEEIWGNLVLIINGRITVHSQNSDGKNPYSIEYNHSKDDSNFFGTIRLVTERNPYKQVEVEPGTQFICIPWDKIRPLRSKFSNFYLKLLEEGSKERQIRLLD